MAGPLEFSSNRNGKNKRWKTLKTQTGLAIEIKFEYEFEVFRFEQGGRENGIITEKGTDTG
jgi:hypothetical protein